MKKLIKVIIILFLFISAFFAFGSNNEAYNNFLNEMNWFQKLIVGTMFEGVRYFDFILPSGYAYFCFMFVGIFIIYPVGNIVMDLFFQTYKIRKELIKTKNTDFSEYGDKAQSVKANKMIDVLEDNNFSLTHILYSVIVGTLGVFFWTSILSYGNEYFRLVNGNSNFLWFDFAGRDWLYIIPGLLILIQIFQMFRFKGTKTIKIFKIMISLSTMLILLPSILSSSIFGMFLLLNNLYFYLERKVELIKNERSERNTDKN